jgi:catechol 2,3-dioxygenase-like lactoylglutathione lyase family enzyme
MDWKIELIFIPVSDVDRAKAFYVDQVGFHADHDQRHCCVGRALDAPESGGGSGGLRS